MCDDYGRQGITTYESPPPKIMERGVFITNTGKHPMEVLLITERGTPAMIHELAPGESFTANVASGVSVECKAIDGR